jgi:2,4-dienoyl-CoA reductase-like NADH-dependent reductase (Old Yellow Enzyme family)
MADPYLFRPLTIRSVTIKNRIMLSPMCQYSSHDGEMNDWHLAHLGARAVGGAGVVCTEATHIEARGRITAYCAGLWNETQRDRMKPITEFVAAQGAVPAIQLAHSGRKGSTARLWDGGGPVAIDAGGWQTIAPTDRPFQAGWQAPLRMTKDMIREALSQFARSAKLAREAGFQIVEIHGAHGYLISEFLSPLSNDRKDEYGGGFDDRIRFLMETIDAVRSEWPSDLPLFLRLSCTDWVEGGWTLEDSIALARLVKAKGDVDLIDCSSGGNDPRQKIPVHPGYQLPFATAIRSSAGIMTGAVGMIHSPDFAESILVNGQADLIVLARTLLADPMWPLKAAKQLRADNVKWPVQYERANIY